MIFFHLYSYIYGLVYFKLCQISMNDVVLEGVP